MESKYPPWQTVCYHFRQFKLRGIWEELLDHLAIEERKRQERENTPSLLAIDSQSVKSVQFIGSDTGVDGGKKIKGRKRTILVDTLGIPWAVKVSSAGLSDNQAGIQALEVLKGKVPRLQKIIGDQGYKTAFIEHADKEYGWKVEIAPQRRTAKTRISARLRASEESLAGREVLRMAEFQASAGQRIRENDRIFRGYAANRIRYHVPQQNDQIRFQNII